MRCAVQDIRFFHSKSSEVDFDVQKVHINDFLNNPINPGVYLIIGYTDMNFDSLEEKIASNQSNTGVVLYFDTMNLRSLDNVLTEPLTMAEVKAFISEENPLNTVVEKL